jgi:hypothetical protein
MSQARGARFRKREKMKKGFITCGRCGSEVVTGKVISSLDFCPDVDCRNSERNYLVGKLEQRKAEVN